MRFDDDWSQEVVLDAWNDSADDARFDRVARCTIVCTDIVGGARLFEAMPRAEFDEMLAGYLDYVRAAFGREHIYHTLRDDIFIALEGEAPEALHLARAFVARMGQAVGGLPFECSVGIASGDVAIVTRGAAAEAQGAPVALAKGLAKLANGRAIFIDDLTAAAIGAAAIAPLSPGRLVRTPHVGRVVRVHEAVGPEGPLGIKERFRGAPRLRAQAPRAGV